MKKINISNKMGVKFNKFTLQVKKHSPEILAAAGVVGIAASTIMACKATTKISDILNDTQEEIDTIHNFINTEKAVEKNYTDEDMKKDLAIVYVQTGMKIAKLYAPAATISILSITSMVTSNQILRKRNVALAAAYKTVDKGFKEYRGRVVDRFGEQVDKELKFNTKAKKIETIEIDSETGKEKRVKKEINVGGDVDGLYTVMFDENCQAFSGTHSYNSFLLRAEQNYANDLLKARGHVFLNEVYDRLGLPRTKAGQIVGWVYNPENPVGDNYIDFGMNEVYVEDAGDCRYILDFNVDGNVLDLM